MVRRGQERSPACLLDGSRVTVVVARYGTKPSFADCGWVKRSVDRSDRPPEQVMELGVQVGHQSIGADEVDHRRLTARVSSRPRPRASTTSRHAWLYWRITFAEPELRDRGLLVRPRAAGRGAVGLDLVEGLDPRRGSEARRRVSKELVDALQDKSANVPDPRRLRRGEWRRQDRHTPGPGGSVGKDDVIPIGVIRPSPIRRAIERSSRPRGRPPDH